MTTIVVTGVTISDAATHRDDQFMVSVEQVLKAAEILIDKYKGIM